MPIPRHPLEQKGNYKGVDFTNKLSTDNLNIIDTNYKNEMEEYIQKLSKLKKNMPEGMIIGSPEYEKYLQKQIGSKIIK